MDDTRPTREEFLAMPPLHRKAHTEPLKADGTPFTEDDLPVLRAARLERLSKVTPIQKSTVSNGQNVISQTSYGIRAARNITR